MQTSCSLGWGPIHCPLCWAGAMGPQKDQRLRQQCDLHAVHDERHLVFEGPAMQPVRDRYPAPFSPAQDTVLLFMWQQDIVGVAQHIKDCFDALGALSV